MFGLIKASLCEAGGWDFSVGKVDPPQPDTASHYWANPPAGSVGMKPLTFPHQRPLPESRGRVILIEGLDLAGKSTLVCNLLANLTSRGIPVRVSRNALCPDNPIAPVADQLRRDPAAGLVETGTLFLASHLWDARHFEPPPAGTIHIQDSCWLRTLAYHTTRGTPQIPKLLREAIPLFPRFDAAVFLTAGIAERRRRLAQREQEQPKSNDAEDNRVVNDSKCFVRHEAILCDLSMALLGSHTIDTGSLTTSDVVMSVVKILGLDQ